MVAYYLKRRSGFSYPKKRNTEATRSGGSSGAKARRHDWRALVRKEVAKRVREGFGRKSQELRLRPHCDEPPIFCEGSDADLSY